MASKRWVRNQLAKEGLVENDGKLPLQVTTNSAQGLIFDDAEADGIRRSQEKIEYGQVLCNWVGGTVSKTSNSGEAVSRPGDGTLKITTSDTGGQAFVATHVLPKPFFINGFKTIQFPVKTPVAFGPAYIYVWLRNKAGTITKLQLNCEDWQPGEWNVMSWSRDSNIVAGGAVANLDIDLIDQIQLVITPTKSIPAASDRELYVGTITADQRRTGRVLWYLDGNYAAQHNYILPILEQCGIRASMAITNATFGASASYMTEAQVLAAAGRGHLLCHHTFGAPQNGYANATDWPTSDAIYNDVMSQWAYLRSVGYTDGIGHAVKGYSGYWNGGTGNIAGRDAIIKDAFQRSGVKSLRNGDYFNAASGGVGQTTNLVDSRRNAVVTVGNLFAKSTSAVNQLKALIDAAETRGEMCSIIFHNACLDAETPTGNTMKVSDIAAVARYAQDRERAGGVLNQTIAEAYRDCYA